MLLDTQDEESHHQWPHYHDLIQQMPKSYLKNVIIPSYEIKMPETNYHLNGNHLLFIGIFRYLQCFQKTVLAAFRKSLYNEDVYVVCFSLAHLPQPFNF